MTGVVVAVAGLVVAVYKLMDAFHRPVPAASGADASAPAAKCEAGSTRGDDWTATADVPAVKRPNATVLAPAGGDSMRLRKRPSVGEDGEYICRVYPDVAVYHDGRREPPCWIHVSVNCKEQSSGAVCEKEGWICDKVSGRSVVEYESRTSRE